LIYLDHNATTPLDPEVRVEMDRCLDGSLGNPSSLHSAGQAARRLIDRARERVARLIGAQPDEILFCSGGTEANNLAIAGTLGARPAHLITTAVEHQAVLNPCRHLEQSGAALTVLPVDGEGLLDPAAVGSALRPATRLVSVMLANNDVGTLQPVAAVATQTRARGVLLHSDAAQAAGKIRIDVAALGVDLLSIAGHKLHGPQGSGALYVRRGTRLDPLLFGGHQERGLRPGTESVAAITGLGKACELAAARLAEDARRLAALRNAFEEGVLARIAGAAVNSSHAPRLPNTSSVSFEGLDGEALAINLDLLEVAVSTGAACSTATREPSHVLLAMGRTPEQARSSIRVSFGRGNTAEQAARAVDRVEQAVQLMRRGAA
jgi:cysteine desulfurase